MNEIASAIPIVRDLVRHYELLLDLAAAEEEEGVTLAVLDVFDRVLRHALTTTKTPYRSDPPALTLRSDHVLDDHGVFAVFSAVVKVIDLDRDLDLDLDMSRCCCIVSRDHGRLPHRHRVHPGDHVHVRDVDDSSAMLVLQVG